MVLKNHCKEPEKQYLGQELHRTLPMKYKVARLAKSTPSLSQERHYNNVKYQQPWIKIGADLFELQSTHSLLVSDYYSRFPIIRRMSRLSSQSVIGQLSPSFQIWNPSDLCLIMDHSLQMNNSRHSPSNTGLTI